MKTAFFFLLTFTLCYSVQAQQTFELSYWKYSNGLNSKQRKQYSLLEKHDADNVLVERIAGSDSNDLYNRTVYIYCNKNKKIAEEGYVLTHNQFVKRNYVYNDSGFLQLMYWKGRNKKGDSIIWREQYFYDTAGRLAKMIETSEDHYPAITHRYQYEKKVDGKVVTETVSMEGRKRVSKKFTKYNNNGLVIKITHKGAAPLFDYINDFIYKYEYDREGNWINKKVLERISKISPWIWAGEYRKKKLQ
jgi:hypothetical protein